MVITGAHGMFSAGYDIGEIPDEEFEERAEALVAHPFTQAIDALEAFPYPTLAVLPGHTIGGGLELALACDLRLALAGIKLGMPPAKLGLVYSHTGLRRFIDAIGAARTRELFLLGRYIDADTALAWGLVSRVADAEAMARRRARPRRRARGQRAPVADRQQARDRGAAGRRGRARRRTSKRSSSSCAAPRSPLRTCARACEPSPSAARPAGAASSERQRPPRLRAVRRAPAVRRARAVRRAGEPSAAPHTLCPCRR